MSKTKFGCEMELRETAATEIALLTAHTALMARNIVEKLQATLEPVLRSAAGTDTPDKPPQKEYPPLFRQWDEHIRSIRESLLTIEDIIERTEL